MSKKMWHKIFKSKSQKAPPLTKINKRHSRIVYEEYQQLNDLLDGEKEQLNFSNEKENEHENGNGPACGNGNGNINVFEQQPLQSSFNSLEFSEAHQQQQQQQQQHQPKQQQQQLSTFSRVRNTFSIRRSSNNSKKLANAKSTAIGTTDPEAEDPMRGADGDPLPPPPLTSDSTIPVPEFVPDQDTQLTPCPCCSRTFITSALRKHVIICEKSSKKRKIFDSSRQRRDGTALSTYVLPKNFGLPNAERTAGLPSPPITSREATTTAMAAAAPPEPVNSPAPVRRKSQTEMVRSTARASLRKAASTLSSGSAAEAPPGGAPAAPAAPLVRERSLAKRIKAPAGGRCPHCDRSFNPKAFDRHVEWCKEKAIQNNMKSTNSQETSKAKERLEARKQYRPPNLKTKRSLARDKYSGNHEELLEAGEMTAPKPNMMSLSMTSSVHSDNTQAQVVRPRTSAGAGSRGRTAATKNQVYMAHDEDPPSSPPPRDRDAVRRSKRKQQESCSEIDDTMERLRRNAGGDSLQLAKLDCAEAPVLQPASRRKTAAKRDKVDAGDKEICLPNHPQVTMTFDELNGLIKRKGGTPICNVEMDEQEIANLTSKCSSTSLVRQARRRIRTRENPNLELRALPPGSVISKDVHFASLDSSLAPLQGMQYKAYSGSDEDSPRAEIQIKMEATTMRTVSRPTKRSGQVMSSSEPMRALPMSGLKQSLEAINQSMGQTVLPRLKLGNERQDYEPDADEPDNYTSDLNDEAEEEDLMSRAAKLIERAQCSPNPGLLDEPSEEEEEEGTVLKLPPLTKQNSNVSRRLVLLEQDENGTMYIKSAPSAKRRSNSGLGDKYDPFLSAKRQLEELCSPNTPPPEEEVTTTTPSIRNLTPISTTTPTATPSIAMTTSLTTAFGKPAQVAQKTTPTSNFRRTSSLRGPRRTPMLNSRPLFATNYRPTIQRGLSDEGPISTNFLKPEEFDEMPVRAACGNDFHSPRVVRRDASASNRKQLLKLPVGGTSEAGNASQAGRSVAKTDSLAVFLKYEHELEQLNAKAAELAAASQLTSKEQKDKSNTLSKQNSAKSLGQSTPTQLPPLTPTAVPPSPGAVKEVGYPPVATPLRLEPISKPAMNPPTPHTPIKLESIFGPRRETGLGLGSGSSSVASDFIDPKLINACDNLHVSSGISSDASSTPQQQLSQSRSRSSSQSTITHERRQSGEARNLLKRKMRLGRNQFLYDASPEDADASSGCSADDEANRSSMEYDEQCWQQQQKQLLANPLPLVMPMVHSAMPTFDDFDFEEFLSSFENENDDEQFPLFKDCREFLLNRSTSRQRSFQKATSSTTQTTATQITTLHSHQSKVKDSHAHRSESKMPEERLQRQQSNASIASSQEEKEKDGRREVEKRTPAEDQPKREIFISIETEANAQGRSPISPESLRHMVGNAQTPIDVLHIENGNEPEHARFSKISDTEDAADEPGDRASQATSRLAPSSGGSALAPNVQLNNAKNMIQRIHGDYRQLGEEAGASVRRMIIVGNGGRGEEQLQQPSRDPNPVGQGQQQHAVKANSPLTPSPSADSDELSSLDGYPMSSSQGSRRGASSKLSSDSAYGSSNSPYSLSRQRSTELQPGTPRSQGLLRPHTASAKLPGSMSDASTQAQTKYGTLKARQRLFAPDCGSNNGNEDGAESCSSGSDNSLAAQPKQQQQPSSNYNYQQQQAQAQSQSQPAYSTNNNNVPMTPTTSQHSLLSNSSMSSSMKMSKFCHECGAKFIIEHAKFCMDCGVKRVVL
ncbi:uncharacterized protein LOC108051224 isoform X10 [Drosophila rhopaloa]|uniref:Uncharacterized protein LOC108051224 isoform X8 n=1 Tax=Drosophila rhopaloa TaxID=1041015 RepID=A0A6P4FFK4_DRORH|nr:uncharacterized protein LOC108051224 isoform X10 [Drosophila rhopaloa]